MLLLHLFPLRLIFVVLSYELISGLFTKSSSTQVHPINFFEPAIILVDPLDEFGNSAEFQDACKENGVQCLTMWSKHTSRAVIGTIGNVIDVCPSNLYDENECLLWLAKHNITNRNQVIGVISETDTGLRTSELFSVWANINSTNGENECRRDKYMMMEALKKSGISYINQCLTDKWDEALAFISSLPRTHPVVVKPSRGAASALVSKCDNLQDANKVFENLLGTPGYANGTISDAVLVQEYIEGKRSSTFSS